MYLKQVHLLKFGLDCHLSLRYPLYQGRGRSGIILTHFRELFGDGLPLAGGTLLYIYGQTSIFSVVDLNRHLVHLAQAEREKKTTTKQEIGTYLASAKWFLKLQEEIAGIARYA